MPQKLEISGNIRKYYLFQFLTSLAFFSPVIVIFWQSKGLNMTQILTLQSLYSLAVLIFDVPTGALADYLGKKISLILGSLFFSLGLFWYGISSSFWQFAIGEMICGIGMAFISGADRAFIHETLLSLGREKDYQKTEGRVRGLNEISRAISNILGGIIGSFSLAFTLIATGFSTFIAFIAALRFYNPRKKLPVEEQTNYWRVIHESLLIVRKNTTVLWLTLFYAVFNSIVFVANWFSQPYLQMLGIPLLYFGVIFSLFNLIAAAGSELTGTFEKLTRGEPFPVITINLTIVSSRVLSLVPSTKAATVLSFQNLVRRLIYVVIGPLIGKISDVFGIFRALQINALILAVILGTLLVLRNRKMRWSCGVSLL